MVLQFYIFHKCVVVAGLVYIFYKCVVVGGLVDLCVGPEFHFI